MGSFTNLEQIRLEKESLQLSNDQHGKRLMMLAKDLTNPSTLGNLLKNSLFSNKQPEENSGIMGKWGHLIIPIAKTAGLLIRSFFRSNRTGHSRAAGQIIPGILQNLLPLLSEFGVSYLRFKEYMAKRRTDQAGSNT